MNLTNLNSRHMVKYTEFIGISILYMLSSILYYYSNILAGIILIFCSVLIFINNARLNKTIIDLYSLFLSSWFFTLGLAMLQLLGYQKQWEIEFLFITYLGIVSLAVGLFIGKTINLKTYKIKVDLKRCYYTVIIGTIISIVMFIISFSKTGIIPLFSDSVSAYRDHYTRYYVIQVGMLPSAGLAFYILKTFKLGKVKKGILYFIIALHLVVFPILYVTRGVFVTGIFFTLPLFYYFSTNKKLFVRIGVISFIIIILIITNSRNYSNEQVDFFFQPKQITFIHKQYRIPNSLTMIYSYLTISHDNFNYNLRGLHDFSYGARLMQPFEVFIRTNLFSDLRMMNKLENISHGLTTHNLMGVIYYDLGVPGIVFILLLYGVIFGLIEKNFRKNKDPFVTLIYGGVVMVVAIGFFTAWTTQFTLWMWWGTTLIFRMIQPKKIFNKNGV